ncbi:MAG: serine--tRNA ligase [Firmicutes bacterium]|nr:serine--tRNA ligase [Bacillota bacterium]
MLDLKRVCDNFDEIKTAISKRAGNYSFLDIIKELNLKRREIITTVENLKAQKNIMSEKIAALKKNKQPCDDLILANKDESEKIKKLDDELSVILDQMNGILYNIPNIPHSSVPVGKSDADNKVVRHFLKPTKFNFEPKAHWDIGENLKILDFAAAAKISGARFTVYKGLGAKLERAVINLMLDTHTKNGYTEVFPPFMVNRDSMVGTGQLPKFEEDMFAVKNTNYYLSPTAEVQLTNLNRNEILDEKALPINYCAYTACFRAEAGAAGRDTRGLIRQHQFNKVELVKFTTPEISYEELEKLTFDAERILKLLKLPYRVSLLCTGDMGFGSSKTYDIEVYMPSYNRYVEISSCSNYEDFQARRANIKFKRDGKNFLVHTLNGSGLAAGRTVAAILENYQNADGSVTVPEALVKYMDCSIIK